MDIASVEFTVGAVGRGDLPTDGLPEIAFSGRSNVGKSSLINQLVRRKRLARTSSNPGKTQQLNFYLVNSGLYFVDLPGYGFVSGGVELRRELSRLARTYIQTRAQLCAVVQLVDARHGPTALDLTMIECLRALCLPFLLVFTKADKLTRAKLQQRFAHLDSRGFLGGLSFTPASSQNGQGIIDVWEWIVGALDKVDS